MASRAISFVITGRWWRGSSTGSGQGLAWRDLPGEFGPWQTVWKRHRRFSADGTWDRVHTALLSHADAVGEIDWNVSIDSTVNRAHQHGTTLSREPSTGGMVESQEFSRGAA